MAAPTNLNKFRKRKAQKDRQARASENRAKHGRTKAEVAADKLLKERQTATLAGKRLVSPPTPTPTPTSKRSSGGQALDPEQNHVSFLLVKDGHETTLQGVGPTRAVDCVSAIWQVLARQPGVLASEVREIYSEWEPADEDVAFLDKTFPEDAQLGYTFKRPAQDGWDDALSEAAKVIRASDGDGAGKDTP